MKYNRFEDLPVWQASMDLAERVHLLAERETAFRSAGDLRSQLCRAALSVSANIAEGFERGTTAELLTFLYIARGSAGEVRSLRFADRLIDARGPKSPHRVPAPGGVGPTSTRGQRESNASRPSTAPNVTSARDANLKPQISDLKSEISNLKSQISNLISLSESCSRQIRAWADSLQNTDIKGQRHLNAKERQAYESDRRAEAFLKQVDEVVRRRVEQRDD